MSDYIFLFDLDSTITKQEILPTIAEKIGKQKEMRELTEQTMQGEIPFKQSFLERVKLLECFSVKEASKIVGDIELNNSLVDFIQKNKDRCYIVTGNLDIWIHSLIKKIGMESNVFCSKANVVKDRISNIVSIVDKNAVVSQIIAPFVAVGDGNNDAEMIEKAVIGIGYGGVRPIADSVLTCATHAFYEEEKLCQFLERLL